ncbi:hypothetical protein [uncultured Flavobacterium sp.]|uniref:hypothetical protein n=1 Tax=uncultured Flavobacterium sp. TaxID=165435 RepID=UPI0025E54222|nr:hypothetical protein [uncultured Flavobacterium sp.]
MKNEKQDPDNLFAHFNGQWDTEEPAMGHEDRFLDRLEGKKKKKGLLFRLAMPAAAAIIIMFGLWTMFKPDGAAVTGNETAAVKLSPKVQETQTYFTGLIKKELAKVEKEDSPETKILVKSALLRMDALEKDYEKLTNEALTKGENKQIIHAMITNLQTRISFLEDVLTKIENIKKLKENYHDNSQT